jgi:hypothetical protein
MKNVAPISCSLAELSPLERRRKIAVREAAALNDVSEATFRRHYGHLIRKIGLRRGAVELCDAIELGEDHLTRNRPPQGSRPVDKCVMKGGPKPP